MKNIERILMVADPSKNAEEIARLFPELVILKGAPQNKLYHQEDVWSHVMMCIDTASKVKDLSTNPLGFMIGTLLHDIGKPATARKKTVIFQDKEYEITMNPGHAVAGEPIAKAICKRLGLNKDLTEYVTHFVRWHDVLFDLNGNIGEAKAFEKIRKANELGCLQDYILFNRRVDSPAKIPGPKAQLVPIVRGWELIKSAPLDDSIKAKCLEYK